jgi:hypothetical protein
LNLLAEAIPPTQWVIAVASLVSAIIALSLGLGLKEWVFRPRVELVLRNPDRPEEISDRVVTKRITTGEPSAFFRMRVVNHGRSTARNVAIRLLRTRRWDADGDVWRRARPELDGWLLQPSNQYEAEARALDVFPNSDRVVDLASVSCRAERDGKAPLFIEISYSWPPNEANHLEPGAWQLELLLCGDNVRAQGYFVGLSFDGFVPDAKGDDIWEHFLVESPSLTQELLPRTH